MKKINVWEVEIWSPEEEEWINYQYYSYSSNPATILHYMEIDEGRKLGNDSGIPDFQIELDDTWTMDEFYSMVGRESSHSLICDYND